MNGIRNRRRKKEMNDAYKPITNCYLIIDTVGNVMTLDMYEWGEYFRAHREKLKPYARDLNLKQMDQVIREYRKGNIKFGDEK